MRLFGQVIQAGHSMELEATGRKRARASSGVLAVDRLSALPDCLIHHIMSFMKARQVVQTCVLSTRWTHLWRSVPCLNIDQEEFMTAGPDRHWKEGWEKFEDFTDHLLIPNNIAIALLDTFRLQVRDWHCEEKAARWIRHAIKYCAQAPDIQRDRLSSRSWRLKKLHLSNVRLDDRFAKHVSTRCLSLEDLELNNCDCSIHEITFHSLKNLHLKHCSWSDLSAITSPTLISLVIDGGSNTYGCLLVIHAPAVAYMVLSVHGFKGGVLLTRMQSLSKASIHIWDDSMSDDLSKLANDQLKLLDSVRNVTSLELSHFETLVFGEEFTTFPEFQNLRTLLLDHCDLSDNFQTLAHFLTNAPNLEKLTLRYCKFTKDYNKRKAKANMAMTFSSQHLNLVDFQCKNLKFTEIIYGNESVRKLVKLLVSISENLPRNNVQLTKVGL
ncbi:hypothetical protein ACP70R_011652 [Stipagrostis hirtigluma subsp. patula]